MPLSIVDIMNFTNYFSVLSRFCQMLSENPNIGKNYSEIASDIFGFLANRHIIFYRILDINEIEITRIIGANMDLKSRIKD